MVFSRSNDFSRKRRSRKKLRSHTTWKKTMVERAMTRPMMVARMKSCFSAHCCGNGAPATASREMAITEPSFSRAISRIIKGGMSNS